MTSGHRAAGQEGPATGRDHVVDTAGLEALLAAALIRDPVDDAAEQRAVAAFRAAREAGAHHARTRRRDDWRSRRRLGGNSVKAVLSVLLGGLTLGGVAVAGIGATGPDTDGPGRDDRRTQVSPGAPGPSTGESAGAGSASAGPDRPAEARDTEAHCRAYEQVEGRGKALDATVWKRLTAAAGGEAKVDAYCAERRERATAGARPGGTPAPGKNPGGTGRAGNSPSGDARDEAPATAPGNASAGAGGSGAGGAGDAPGGSGAADGGSGDPRGKPARPGAGTP
ncbi:hypothetical protein [Streptomyces sp. Tu 3180]|uniref:hypothetical protein n=1 Tax=Streptomyces sp. Tu 3180 TaxID=2682611 RepID=UPI00135694B3|nr:hypothetical protein [Streptomyces sp. Tu 3180]